MIFPKTLAGRYRLHKKRIRNAFCASKWARLCRSWMKTRSECRASLKLSMAGDVDAPSVIGGFPKTGLDAYPGKLVRAGYSVAIALQDDRKERYVAEVVRVKVNPAGRPD